MTSAEDITPEATLLISLNQNALQRPTRIRYEVAHQMLCWDSIGWLPTKIYDAIQIAFKVRH
jgi:hypothetical protein